MIEVIILAVALSMDAFAVSIGIGIKEKKNIRLVALKAGLFFGFFQAFMPFIGFIGGVGLKQYLQGFDTVIAFVLLVLIGIKMIYEAYSENTEEIISKVSNKILFMLAIATSIDAMAAGFSLHLFDLNVYISLIIIGLSTFLISIVGVYIGNKGRSDFESKAEILGGVVLIAIGFKLLIL